MRRPSRYPSKHQGLALAALACATLAALSCKSGDETSIVVHVLSDDALGLDGVDLSARVATVGTGGGHDMAAAHFPDPAHVTWKLTPTGDDKMFAIEIEARGMRGSETVVSQRAAISFQRSRRAEITMSLAQACVVVSCAPSLTCEQGACVDPEVVGRPGSSADAGSQMDAPTNVADRAIPDVRVDVAGERPDAGPDAAVNRPLGDPCSASTDCASIHCVDGVCCNAACPGQCESCASATNRGTCVAVTTPRTPCMGTGTACAGRCDGTARTACVYPGATTPCGAAASCSGNTETRATSCAGNGTCTPPMTVSCAPFGCSGTICATGCPSGQGVCSGACVDILSTPSHCGTNCVSCGTTVPKCLSGSCVQCITAADCSGTASTCGANHTCACRQPSPTNLLGSSGFDLPSSAFAWTLSEGASWVNTDDADGCSGSGSIKVQVTMPLFDFGNIQQCVRINPLTTYFFGYKYKQDPNVSLVCYAWSFASTDCSGDVRDSSGVQGAQVPNAVDWTPTTPVTFTPLAGALSAKIFCQISSLGFGWFDQIYLNPNAALF